MLPMARISISFTQEFYDALRAVAEQEERTLSSVVRRAAAAYLRERGYPNFLTWKKPK